MTNWILTGSLDNFRATEQEDFKLVGFKERRRKQAEEIEIGDRIIFYITKMMSFAGAVTVTGDLFEDRTPIWPGKPGNPDPYPWRRETKPEFILHEELWLPADIVKEEMEHIQKWPKEHWKLAFQGQLRQISERDGDFLMDRLAAQGAPIEY